MLFYLKLDVRVKATSDPMDLQINTDIKEPEMLEVTVSTEPQRDSLHVHVLLHTVMA